MQYEVNVGFFKYNNDLLEITIYKEADFRSMQLSIFKYKNGLLIGKIFDIFCLQQRTNTIIST